MREYGKHILQTIEEANAYFLSTYERIRLHKLESPPEESDKDTDEDGCSTFSFSISTTDYPEDAIDKSGVEFLITAYHDLGVCLKGELPLVSDPATAAVYLLRRHILALAYDYLAITAMFLAADARYHPDAPLRIDMRGILSPEHGSLSVRMKTLGEALPVAFCILDANQQEFISLFERELRILHLAGDVFFDTFESIFDLKTILKCRKGFNQFMQTVGTQDGIESVANYVRRYNTMYREIASLQSDVGTSPAKDVQQVAQTLVPKVDEICQELRKQSKSVGKIARSVSNMDKRLRQAIAVVKNLVRGFIKLFKPGHPTPRHATVVKALEMDDNYPCLGRIADKNRRLQLIAVIEYTRTHPIVHEGKSRDEFTLSNAVRAVWNAHQAAWSKMLNGYNTFAKLKAACYNLCKGDNDPFTYQT